MEALKQWLHVAYVNQKTWVVTALALEPQYRSEHFLHCRQTFGVTALLAAVDDGAWARGSACQSHSKLYG